MTESKFETVSGLVDNFQSTQDDVIEVSKNEQMSETWSRYHLIGDVLRDEAPAQIDLNLSINIASAIAAEPTVLAPQRKTAGQKIKATVIKLVKPFGQIAIAASAATLMIVGVQQNVAQNELIMPTEVVQTIPVFGTAQPVSLNVGKQVQTSQEAKKQAYIEQQRRFQALLADHHQQLKLKQINSQAKVDKPETTEAIEEQNSTQ
ncbi:MAG: sigma-E factor negative regulatory protein [Thalassotalea sp.]